MPLWPKITGNILPTGNYFLWKSRACALRRNPGVCYTYRIGSYDHHSGHGREGGPWGSFCRKTAHWPAACAGPPRAAHCPMPSFSPAAGTAWPPPASPPPPWSAQAEGGRPCLQCRQCRKVMEDIHPDVQTVQDPDHRELPVDLLRRLRQDAYIRPNDGAAEGVYLPGLRRPEPSGTRTCC